MAQNDASTTVMGNVAMGAKSAVTGAGITVVTFRLATTHRVWRPNESTFVNAGTSFLKVTCWRQLGRHVEQSIQVGDPVIVHGRLYVEEWTRADGITAHMTAIEAQAVGHNLRWGTALYSKAVAPAAASDPSPDSSSDLGPDFGVPSAAEPRSSAPPAIDRPGDPVDPTDAEPRVA